MNNEREQRNVRPDMAALPEDSAFYKKEEPKTEKQKLSEMNFKQKVCYLAEYYGKAALVVLVILVAAVSILSNIIFSKESALDVMAVNTTIVGDSAADDGAYYESVLTACGIDPKSVSVGITSGIRMTPDASDSGSVANMQVIQSRFMTNSVDVFLSDQEFFSTMANFDNFGDLRNYLTKEQLAGLGDAVINATSEETGDMYPAGILLKNNAWIADTGWYSGDVVVGIAAGTRHSDTAVELVRQILESK